jgi:hypothetical protein
MSLSLKALCKQFYEFIRFQFYRTEMMIFFIGKEAWRKGRELRQKERGSKVDGEEMSKRETEGRR